MLPTVIVNAAASTTATALVELRSNMIILPAFRRACLIATKSHYPINRYSKCERKHTTSHTGRFGICALRSVIPLGMSLMG
jgi:hypothetical protein